MFVRTRYWDGTPNTMKTTIDVITKILEANIGEILTPEMVVLLSALLSYALHQSGGD